MQIKAFEPSKLWHRIRGHRIGLIPFDPTTAKSPLLATIVRDECSCGAQWVFYGLTMTATYAPAPKPALVDEGAPWCNSCGGAVNFDVEFGKYFHVANPTRRGPCVYGDSVVPARSVRGF